MLLLNVAARIDENPPTTVLQVWPHWNTVFHLPSKMVFALFAEPCLEMLNEVFKLTKLLFSFFFSC